MKDLTLKEMIIFDIRMGLISSLFNRILNIKQLPLSECCYDMIKDNKKNEIFPFSFIYQNKSYLFCTDQNKKIGEYNYKFTIYISSNYNNFNSNKRKKKSNEFEILFLESKESEYILRYDKIDIKISKTNIFDLNVKHLLLGNIFPKKLFKYKSSIKFGQIKDTTKDYAMDAACGFLYCPEQEELNDPFDCDIEFEEKVLRIAYYVVKHYKNLTLFKLYKKMIEFLENISFNKKNITEIEIVDTLLEHGFLETNYNYFQSKIEEYFVSYKQISKTLPKLKTRILSLTTKQDNLLMWSHYGDSHKGICLEYTSNQIEKLLFENKMTKDDFIFAKVIYSEKRFSIADLSFFKYFIDEKMINYLFRIEMYFTKFEDWSYEDEYRFIILTPSDEFEKNGYILSKCFPSSCYFGCKFPNNIPDVKKEIFRRTSKIIKTYKFEKDQFEYKLNYKTI